MSLLSSWVKGVLFTDRERTEGQTALSGNRIPFECKLEMPIDHPSGGVKEAGFARAFLQE